MSWGAWIRMRQSLRQGDTLSRGEPLYCRMLEGGPARRAWRWRVLAASTGAVLLLALAVRLDPVQEGLTARYFFSETPTGAPVHTRIDAPPFTGRMRQVWAPPMPHTFSATW